MKKQIKKLSLNKKTITNLNSSEMSKHVGGTDTWYSCRNCGTWYCTFTCHGQTCNKKCGY